jgi:hypothetical protein
VSLVQHIPNAEQRLVCVAGVAVVQQPLAVVPHVDGLPVDRLAVQLAEPLAYLDGGGEVFAQ